MACQLLRNNSILCYQQLSLLTSQAVCLKFLCRAPEEKTYLVRVIGEGSVGEIVVSMSVIVCQCQNSLCVFDLSYFLASLVHRGGCEFW